jgi:hypothetical protein
VAYSPSAATSSVPVQTGVPVHTIADALANGPYRNACTVACWPASPLTMTRSWMAAPGLTRLLLTIVCTRGCASTRKLSPGARHGVVRPRWPASPGTTSTYVYHPTRWSLAGGVVTTPDPVAATELLTTGVPSHRIASCVANGP